ncbi:MAG: HAMP domain-containing histidine kinase [Anaerolineae bacterium]|nr:HAMP domain-containing histidine kinase [Anaerolineae bacterium]
MHSLRLKLILTFLVISVTGTLLTTVIVSRFNERALNEFIQEQEQAALVAELLAYYETNGSWQGAAQTAYGDVLPDAAEPKQNDPVPQPDSQEPGQSTPAQQAVRPPPFALADETGVIIIPNRQFQTGSVVPNEMLADGLPLAVDGVQVGTLLMYDEPPPRNPAEEAFAAKTNQALFIGALGATAVAIILAIIMSRTLTRPLRELAAASREMAQGNLQQEVPVRTKDELGELALAFNQMSADLTYANQSRQQMTADIAHDLRTPLTVLSGYLEAMEDGTLAPTPARLQMMQQEVDVLMRLVADLRTLSLADAGQLALHYEPVDIGELLAQVQAVYAHQAAQQNVTIEVKTAYSELIELDSARMRQALGNLVSNALRYTPAGGVITLAAAPTEDQKLQLSVADTGSGIPEADLPHIFNRFYRGDLSRQEGQGESGLGLAIVKSLVTAHGGEIAVASRPGAGTIFTILLPRASRP